MTRLISVIWIIILANLGCKSSHDSLDKVPDGTYTGTFQRQLAFGGGEIANITTTFSSNTWNGHSDKPNYPSLCQGIYEIQQNKIVFTNLCDFTADFDLTLILSGEYGFTLNGNQLEILRSDLGPATDTWTDKYTLTRQE